MRGIASLAVPRAAAMRVLRTPDRLAAALPSVEDFALGRAGRFTATIRPALALGEVPLRTVWQPVEAGEHEMRYRVEGRTDEHAVELEATLRVFEKGISTEAVWSIDFHVTGALRTAGQRVLEAVIAAQAASVLDAVAREAGRDGR